MKEFDLEGRESVELNKLLKLTGMCPSGGAAKMAIAAGRVTVDDQLELRKRRKLRPGNVVAFDGQRIAVSSAGGSGAGQGG